MKRTGFLLTLGLGVGVGLGYIVNFYYHRRRRSRIISQTEQVEKVEEKAETKAVQESTQTAEAMREDEREEKIEEKVETKQVQEEITDRKREDQNDEIVCDKCGQENYCYTIAECDHKFCKDCIHSIFQNGDYPMQCPLPFCEEDISLAHLIELPDTMELPSLIEYRNMSWHVLYTTKPTVNGNEDENTKASVLAIRKSTISCPKCLIPTSHFWDEGCHHITCPCGFEWCWCCTLEWEQCAECPKYCDRHCKYCLTDPSEDDEHKTSS